MIINKPNNIWFLLLLFLTLLFPLSASAKKELILWQSKFDYIGLAEVDSKNVKNDHPVEITPQAVYELLASIKLKDADKSLLSLDFLDFSSDDDEDDLGDSRLFSKAALIKISKPIAEALSKASADQDVTFTITSSHKKTLGKGSLSTAGRFFFTDGQLNLIVGELRVDLEQKYRQRGGYADIAEKIDYNKLKNFRLRLGSRKSESDIDYTFVTDDAHFLKPYKNKFRKDWLLIHVETIQQQITERRQKAERKENIVEETVGIKQQTQQIDQEQEQLKEKVERMERYLRAQEKQEAAAARVEKPTRRAAQKPRSVEERLTELKSLFDKGYITEEIYKEKTKQILSDL